MLVLPDTKPMVTEPNAILETVGKVVQCWDMLIEGKLTCSV